MKNKTINIIDSLYEIILGKNELAKIYRKVMIIGLLSIIALVSENYIGSIIIAALHGTVLAKWINAKRNEIAIRNNLRDAAQIIFAQGEKLTNIYIKMKKYEGRLKDLGLTVDEEYRGEGS